MAVADFICGDFDAKDGMTLDGVIKWVLNHVVWGFEVITCGLGKPWN